MFDTLHLSLASTLNTDKFFSASTSLLQPPHFHSLPAPRVSEAVKRLRAAWRDLSFIATPLESTFSTFMARSMKGSKVSLQKPHSEHFSCHARVKRQKDGLRSYHFTHKLHRQHAMCGSMEKYQNNDAILSLLAPTGGEEGETVAFKQWENLEDGYPIYCLLIPCMCETMYVRVIKSQSFILVRYVGEKQMDTMSAPGFGGILQRCGESESSLPACWVQTGLLLGV